MNGKVTHLFFSAILLLCVGLSKADTVVTEWTAGQTTLSTDALSGIITLNIGGSDPADTVIWGTAPFEISNSLLSLNTAGAPFALSFLNPIDLGAVARTVIVDSTVAGATVTMSGALSGAGASLTKSGTGTLYLSGDNTYTGTTLVSGGILAVRSANGVSAGTVTNNSTIATFALAPLVGDITVENSFVLSYTTMTGVGSLGAIRNISGNNTISGDITISYNNSTNYSYYLGVDDGTSLTLTGQVLNQFAVYDKTLYKVGTGSLIMGAANRISSDVSLYIAEGIVDFGGLAQSVRNLTVGPNGTLSNATSVTAGTFTYLKAGNTVLDASITGATNFTFNATGTLELTGNNNYTGVTTVGSAANAILLMRRATDIGSGRIDITQTTATFRIDPIAADLVIPNDFRLTSSTMTGSGSVGAIYNASGDNTISGGININFSSSSSWYYYFGVEDGSSLTLSGLVTRTDGFPATSRIIYKVGTGALIFGAANRIADDVDLYINTGTVDFGGFAQTVRNLSIAAGGTLVNAPSINNSGTITYSKAGGTFDASMTGTGGFHFNAAGTLELTGINTYSGVTTISVANAILRVRRATDIGSGQIDITNVTSTFRIDPVADNLVIPNNFRLTSSDMTGSGAVGAIYNASGDNTISGGININFSSSSSWNYYFGVENGSSLTITGLVTRTDGFLAYSRTIYKVGTGTLIFGAADRIASDVDLSIGAGTVDFGGFAQTVRNLSIGAGGTLVNAPSINNSGTITYSKAGGTFDASMTGTGGFHFNAAGTLELTGTNTYSGITTISGGNAILLMRRATDIGSGQIDITSTIATFRIDPVAGNLVFANNFRLASADMTGSGSVGAIYNASGDNTISGGININYGSSSSRSYFLGVEDGSSLTITGLVTRTDGFPAYSRTIYKVGTGTLIFGAADRIASDIDLYIAAGTVDFGGFAQTARNLTITSQVRLINAPSVNISGMLVYSKEGIFNSDISGVGSFTYNAAGVLELTGNNTYAGTTTISGNQSTLVMRRQTDIGSGTIYISTSYSSLRLDPVSVSGPDLTINNPFIFNVNGAYGAGSLGAIYNYSGDNTINGGLGLNAGSNNDYYFYVGVNEGTTLTLTGAVTTTYAGVYTRWLQKRGTGTLNIGAENVFAAGTNISLYVEQGTVNFNGFNQSIGKSLYVINGATLDFGVGFGDTLTVGATYSVGATATILNAPANVDAASFVYSKSGVLSTNIIGTGSFTYNATGELELTGTNTYAGTTTISGNQGTFVMRRQTDIGSGTIYISLYSTLRLDPVSVSGPDLTLNNAILFNQNAAYGAGNLGAIYNYSGDNTINGGLGLNGTSNNDYYYYVGVNEGTSLTLTGAVTTTYAGVYTRWLQKRGTGTLNIGAENVFAAGTKISLYVEAGTVNFNGFSQSIGNNLHVLDAGTLDFGAGYGDTLTTGGYFAVEANATILNMPANISAGSLYWRKAGTLSANIMGTGSVIHDRAVEVELTGNNTYSGGTTISAGLLKISSMNNIGTGAVSITGAAATLGISGGINFNRNLTTSATNYSTWGGYDALGVLRSISGNNTFSGTLQFANVGTGAYSYFIGVDADSLNVTGTINFAGTTGVRYLYKVGDGALVMGGTNRVTSSGTHAIVMVITGGAVDLNGFSQTINNALYVRTGGALVNSGGAATYTASQYIFDSGDATVSAAITGAGTITKSSAGTVILSGANTLTGATTITGGTLQTGRVDTLSTGNLTINGAGAALELDGYSQTITGTLTLANGNLLSTSSPAAFTAASYAVSSGTISAALGGAGALTKTGAGTVILSGANTHSGGTAINEGVLQVNHADALGSGAVTFVPGASLGLGGGVDLSRSLTLSADSTYYGYASTGILRSVSGNNTYSGTLTFGSTNVTAYTYIIGVDADKLTLTGTIAFAAAGGERTIQKVGAGTLAFGAADRIVSNGRTVHIYQSAGTIDLSGYGHTIGGTYTLVDGNLISSGLDATLTAANFTVYSGTISANIAGAGTLTKTGAGTATITGSNSMLVKTSIASGVLVMPNVAANASYTEFAGGILGGNGAYNLTLGQGAGQIYWIPGSYSGGFKAVGGNLTVNLDNGAALQWGVTPSFIQSAALYLYSEEGFEVDFVNPINFQNATRAVDVVGAAKISGVITSTGASGYLYKTGTGTLTLTADPDPAFTGYIQVGYGILYVDNPSKSLSRVYLTGGTLNVTGGTLTVLDNITISSGEVACNLTSDNTGIVYAINTTATITLASNFAGAGQLQKVGTGLVYLTGNNTYTGMTQISGGTLAVADLATNLGPALIRINGGVLGTSGLLDQVLGTEAGQIDFSAATGGLSAIGGNLTVRFNDGAQLTMGSSPFHVGSTFYLNIAGATHDLDFQNPIDIGTVARVFLVDAMAATLSGQLTGITNAAILKSGAGTLILPVANNYPGTATTNLSGGTLLVRHQDSLGTVGTGNINIQVGTATFAIEAGAGNTISINRNINVGTTNANYFGTGNLGFVRSISGDNVMNGNISFTYTSGTAYDNYISVEAGTLTMAGQFTRGAGGARTITKLGAGTLIFGSADRIVGASMNLNITAGTLDFGGFDQSISGTLTLAAGTSLINSGLLTLGGASIAGSISGGETITINSTGAVTLASTGSIIGNADITGTTVTVDGTITGNTIVTAANFVLNETGIIGGTLDLTNTISFSLYTDNIGVFSMTGNATFKKYGSGTLVFDGNTNFAYNGGTEVYNGTLQVKAIEKLGPGNLAIVRQSGGSNIGTLAFDPGTGSGWNVTATLTLRDENLSDYDFTGVNNTGALRFMTGNNTMSGNVHLQGKASGTPIYNIYIGVDTGSNLLMAGTFTTNYAAGTRTIVKVGGGTMTVNAAGKFANYGLNVAEGTFNYGGFAENFGGHLTVGEGATLTNIANIVAQSITIGGTLEGNRDILTAGAFTVTSSGSLTGSNSVTAAGVTIRGNVAAGSFALSSGNYTVGTAGQTRTISAILGPGGTGNLTMDQAGITILTQANNFAGSTTIAEGMLVMGNNAAISAGALTISGTNASIGLSNGVTLTRTFSFVSGTNRYGYENLGFIRSYSGVNTMEGNIAIGGTTYIGADAGATLQLSGAISPVQAAYYYLHKVGAGTLKFTSDNRLVNTYIYFSVGTANDTYAGAIDLNGTTQALSAALPFTVYNGDIINTAPGTGIITCGVFTMNIGTIGSNVTISSAGTVTLGQVTIGDNSTLSSVGTFTIGQGTIGDNVTINATGAFSMTSGTIGTGVRITAASSFTFSSDADIEFDGILAGVGTGLIKNGTGILTLTGANTFSGATYINNGILSFSEGSLPTASIIIFNGNGGIIETSGNITRSLTTLSTGADRISWADAEANGGFAAKGGDLTVNLGGYGDGVIWGSAGFMGITNGSGRLIFGSTTADGVVTFVNPIDLGTGYTRTIQVDQNAANNNNWAVISGTISGSTSVLNKIGEGKLVLSGENTFEGGINLTAGILQAAGNNALGTGVTTLAQSTTLEIANNISLAGTIEINSIGDNYGAGNLGVIRNVSGDNTFSGTLSINSTNESAGTYRIGVDSGTALLISGTMTFAASGGSRTIHKTGEGTLKLGAVDRFIANGRDVQILLSEGSLDINGFNQTITGLFTFAGGSLTNSGAAATFTAAGFDLQSGTVAATLAGPGILRKTTDGIAYLNGANQTSLTRLEGGILIVQDFAASSAATEFAGGYIGGSGTITPTLGVGAGELSWAGNGGFAAYGGDLTVNIGGAGGTIVWDALNSIPDGVALELSSGISNAATIFENGIDFAGSVRTIRVQDNPLSDDDFAIISGTLSNGGFDKMGSGTLQLTGANTYAGLTRIIEGTLQVNAALLGSVIIGNGARLKGNATVSGGITVQSGGAIAPGNSPGTIDLDGSDLSMLSGSIYEWEFAAADDYDKIIDIGNLTLEDGWILKIIPITGSPYSDASTLYELFTYTGSLVFNDPILDLSLVNTYWSTPYVYVDAINQKVILTGLNNAPAPEPAALGIIGIALLALKRRIRRRKV